MAVSIRLRREGKLNRAYYRVVVAEKLGKRDGKFIEQVGTYDPIDKKKGFTIKLERVDFWLKKGAQASDTVAQFVKKARKKAALAAV
jgi:small subunit ribosomal protein S16